jgi:Fe-S-cluster-containing dehydrogenase component/formate-dependent nitrite reductase membrane component NrfD
MEMNREMTNFGFVINHAVCIGCHACTVACKAENNVPLGAFRTWVKYIEKGRFPHTRRHFAVLRCNQCQDAPCVTICPVVALFQRDNGIVDFDADRCIGCKACMQACPYDALYINPDTNTAEKCHFCAHRVEVGLKPACEIVCPERAIISGDLDDPHSEISRLVALENVQVRKPEQGTRPKVFYLEADEAALDPGATRLPSTYMWSAVRPDANETLLQLSTPERAEDVVRRVYDVDHPAPWGWKVGAYLWTKSVAAGSLLLAAIGLILGYGAGEHQFSIVAPLLALLFIGATNALLIADLKRPERFWRLLLRPNWRSWLVWGGYILTIFSLLALAWLVVGMAGDYPTLRVLVWPSALLAILTAVYSAFLFGQAEGRDFWQSPLLLWHLLVAAALAGSAMLTLIGAFAGARTQPFVSGILLGSLLAHFLALMAELLVPHPNADAAAAAHLIVWGRFRERFWGYTVGVGIALPVIILAPFAASPPPAPLAIIASLVAMYGLYVYEELWIKAGQAIPLS